jgi:hypothetical protein
MEEDRISDSGTGSQCRGGDESAQTEAGDQWRLPYEEINGQKENNDEVC